MPVKTIQIETLLQYRFPNRISYSPTGVRAAVIVSRPKAETNSYEHAIYRIENGQFTEMFPVDSNRTYQWEDDEHILFLRQLAPERTAVCRGSLLTGDVQTVAEFPLYIEKFARMDNGYLAALCRTDTGCPDLWQMPPEEADEIRRQRAEEAAACEVMDELPFYINGRPGTVCHQRDSLFLLHITDHTAVRITPTWFQTQHMCADQDKIYYFGSTYHDKMSVFYELWCYSVPEGKARCIYNGGVYNMRALALWNGRLLILGNTNPNVKLFHGEFYEVNVETGEIRSFCPYDRSIRSYVTGDCAYGEPRVYKVFDDKLYFLSSIDNEAWLMALDTAGTVKPVLRHEGAIGDFDICGGKLMFTALWHNCPLECYEADLSAPEETARQISAFHTELLQGCYVAEPQPHSFQFGQWRIDGWALLPEHFDPDKQYPAILDIHGGPNACYSTAYCHEMQVWAARGFIVIFCNPIGSEGRGDAFMNIHGHFGQQDYECLMQFTDEMLRKYPQIDQKRLCVTGGSYGGFMTNWIITHTNRFAAAATQRSIANWITTVLLADNGWYNMPLQMQGDINTGTDRLWEQSPLKYISKASTPTLVLHSDEDYSVPVAEGLQMFSALKVNGVDTKLVYIKGENHELSRSGRPLQRIRRLREITAWLEDHIRNNTTAAQ